MTQVPPLLDPTLSFKEAVELNSNVHPAERLKQFQAEMKAFSAKADKARSEDDRRALLTKLVQEYPLRHQLVPTVDVVKKMILRAGQIETEDDIRLKINPNELKRIFPKDYLTDLYEPYL